MQIIMKKCKLGIYKLQTIGQRDILYLSMVTMGEHYVHRPFIMFLNNTILNSLFSTLEDIMQCRCNNINTCHIWFRNCVALNVRENRKGNHVLTPERHRQHWTKYTQSKKRKEKTQNRILKRLTRTAPKTRGEASCSGRICSFCFL